MTTQKATVEASRLSQPEQPHRGRAGESLCATCYKSFFFSSLIPAKECSTVRFISGSVLSGGWAEALFSIPRLCPCHNKLHTKTFSLKVEAILIPASYSESKHCLWVCRDGPI